MIITAQKLRDRGACPGAVQKFEQNFGDKVTVTPAALLKAEKEGKVSIGYLRWLVYKLFPVWKRKKFEQAATLATIACAKASREVCTCGPRYAHIFGKLLTAKRPAKKAKNK